MVILYEIIKREEGRVEFFFLHGDKHALSPFRSTLPSMSLIQFWLYLPRSRLARFLSSTVHSRNLTGLDINIPGKTTISSEDRDVILTATLVIRVENSTLDTITKQIVPKVTAPGESGFLSFRLAHLSTPSDGN